MKLDSLPDIPNSYLVLVMIAGLIVLRAFGIDTWVTASLSVIIGYLTGVKMEQARRRR